MEDFLTILGALAMIALALLVFPFIGFWLAYFGGWICSLVIGEPLTNGLNTLFGVSYFTKDMIPLCAGTLGWVGSYFKSTTYTRKEKK